MYNDDPPKHVWLRAPCHGCTHHGATAHGDKRHCAHGAAHRHVRIELAAGLGQEGRSGRVAALGSVCLYRYMGENHVMQAERESSRQATSGWSGDEEGRWQVIRQYEESRVVATESRRGYTAGAAWDEGNMIQAMARLKNPTIAWRFGDG